MSRGTANFNNLTHYQLVDGLMYMLLEELSILLKNNTEAQLRNHFLSEFRRPHCFFSNSEISKMCSAELLDAFLTMWIQRIGERPRDPNNHLWDKIVLSRRQTVRQQVIEESDISLQQSYYERKVPAKAEAETNINESGNDSSTLNNPSSFWKELELCHRFHLIRGLNK